MEKNAKFVSDAWINNSHNSVMGFIKYYKQNKTRQDKGFKHDTANRHYDPKLLQLLLNIIMILLKPKTTLYDMAKTCMICEATSSLIVKISFFLHG